jgi:hypothetical protein
LCESCGKQRPLLWDHDHDTGQFRGWLCQTCNSGIGMLGDDLAGVARAYSYLRRRVDKQMYPR